MKNIFLSALVASAALTSCSTVQSIVQNTVPYTTNVLISSGVGANNEVSVTSSATNIAQFVGAGNNMVKDIRVSSARATATIGSSSADLGNFKSIKVYLSGNNTGEVLVAQRTDISSTVGNTVSLDPATTSTLDHIVKSESVKMRVAYVLKNTATADTNLRVSINFSSVPITQ